MRIIPDTHRHLVCRTREMASQTKAQRNKRHPCKHMETTTSKKFDVFGSTLQTTCLPPSRRTERPRCEVKSSMSIFRVGCGKFAWARICLISPTKTSPANKFTDLSRWRVRATPMLTLASAIKCSVCRYYHQSGDQALCWPCGTHAVARNGLKSFPFPSNFHTSKREIVENFLLFTCISI